MGNLYLLDITPLSDVRTAYETDSVNELNTQFCIIFFLLLNIFLGIIGTFWFRTQHRRAEIALRMALGSTRWGICGRLMGEGVLLLLISAIPALVVGVEFGICRTGGSYTYAFYGRSFCDYNSGHFHSDCWNDCHWNRIPCPSCHEYRTG